MTRKIKFRAWDTIDKEMFRVVMLAAPQDKDYLIVSGRGGSTTTKHDQCVLMQFTGLKDKNGKEIYEGDVVRIDNGIPWVIEWKDEGFKMRSQPEFLDVIGNVWENPELLDANKQEA